MGDKKQKKEKKEKRQAPAESAPKASKTGGSANRSGKRAPLYSDQFFAEANGLRDKYMDKVSKKDEQRRTVKADLKSALQSTTDIATKSLKMCGTSSSAYLLEHIQADVEKLKIHLAQDEDYIEEVRFKHNKLMDLLDQTRDYSAVNLQRDMARNNEISSKCKKLTYGDKVEEAIIDQDELNELIKMRNSIRTWYGGQNLGKMASSVAVGSDGDKAMFSGLSNAEIRVPSGAKA